MKRSKRVLLVHPEISNSKYNFNGVIENEALELEYIVSVLKEKNIECEIFDVQREEISFEEKIKEYKPNIMYICGDSEKIPFKDNTFDILITSESFHHYPNPQKVIKEFKRVLKHNGKLILCDMYRPIIIRNIMNIAFKFTNTGDVKIYNKKEIIKLLNDNNYQNIVWENSYSSFICEAINNKNE